MYKYLLHKSFRIPLIIYECTKSVPLEDGVYPSAVLVGALELVGGADKSLSVQEPRPQPATCQLLAQPSTIYLAIYDAQQYQRPN